MENLFPAAPAGVPAAVTAPTPAFRREVRRVVAGLVFFALVYLLLVVLAAAFTAVCIYLGIALMMLTLSFYTILIGVGLISMGCLVLFFLVKFLFAAKDEEGETPVELNEADEPVLFDFIRRTAAEVGTHFPKRVLLTPEVNASVSYSSNFWSLFFPVRKNLTLGLGLVNSVNVSEFKAVLAHEFGHFSQRSMRLGTYVYYVNRVIYNLLFRNDGWAGAVDNIAGVHAILAIFAQGAVHIVLGIQWVLRKFYAAINLRQRSLSRAMEFHADAISASVSGSNNAIAAMRRIDFGATTYWFALDNARTLAGGRQKAGNFFHWQHRAGAAIAAEHSLEIDRGLPVITETYLASRIAPRVGYTDQWASHPTQAEREAALKVLALQGEVCDEPAWRLFRNPEHWQRDLTASMYNTIEDAADWEEIGAESLTVELGNGLAREYRGYYDRPARAATDLDALRAAGTPHPLPADAFDRLFGDALPDRLRALEQDVQTLRQIENEEIDTHTFDFDGQQYARAQAGEVRTRLEAEIEAGVDALEKRRAEAARVFYDAALADGPAAAEALLERYRDTDAACARMTRVVEAVNPVLATIHRLNETQFFLLTEDTGRFHQFVQTDEPAWRSVLADVLQQTQLPADLTEKAKKFLDAPGEYKNAGGLDSGRLVALHELAIAVYQAVHEQYVTALKKTLAAQSATARAGSALASA